MRIIRITPTSPRTINEEIDEIDDEEDEDALEVDLGDEDDE